MPFLRHSGRIRFLELSEFQNHNEGTCNCLAGGDTPPISAISLHHRKLEALIGFLWLKLYYTVTDGQMYTDRIIAITALGRADAR